MRCIETLYQNGMRQESVYRAAKVAGSLSRLASDIGVSKQLVNHWARGVSEIPVVHCVKIEALAQGAVMRWDLRPNDWWQIWPELIAHPDAPPIPAELQVAAISKGFQLCFPDQAHAVREVNHG